MRRYDYDLCERVIDRFCDAGGTPEDLGSLLYDAVLLDVRFFGVFSRENWDKKKRAEKIIRNIEEGDELMKMERKFHGVH